MRDVREAAAVRLRLDAEGRAVIRVEPAPCFREKPVRVVLAPLPVASTDFRLRFKTSLRDFYDAARSASGAEEVVFVDADGFLTEGSFTNVFVARDGVLITPPAARGLLPGVLRAALLDEGKAREDELVAADLAAGFLIGNALRGLAPAVLVG
jgi:para-aminobenzoate synthetase / 4-amino-4-deoxychorismate lyase